MLALLRSSSGVDGVGVRSSCMTVELCGYIAQTQGFTFFGVEAGSSETLQGSGRHSLQCCFALVIKLAKLTFRTCGVGLPSLMFITLNTERGLVWGGFGPDHTGPSTPRPFTARDMLSTCVLT